MLYLDGIISSLAASQRMCKSHIVRSCSRACQKLRRDACNELTVFAEQDFCAQCAPDKQVSL